MAIRIKTKWHRSQRAGVRTDKPKSLPDLASVVAFNLWKIAHEAFRRMEKEGFRFAQDRQVTEFITEFLAYLAHAVDRMLFGHVSDTERAEFMQALVKHLANTLAENQQQLLGPGDYVATFIAAINTRFDQYAECAWDGGPSYEMTRNLALPIAEIMHTTDDRWVLEQVMDIEAPEAMKSIKRVVQGVLGIS